MPIASEDSETLALRALEWIVGNEDLLPVFLGSTGATEHDLRAGAVRPEFLAAVLDFLLIDDAWVVAFCDTMGVPYDRLLQARATLPGGAQVNWT